MRTTLPPARPDTYGTDPGDPGRARTIGGVGELLDPEDVTQFVQEAFSTAGLDKKRVCLVVPDGTRTCPLPLLLGAAQQALAGRAKQVTVIIALGIHHGMTGEHLARHLGYPPGHGQEIYPGWTIVNHESWLPETITALGTIEANRLAEFTGGLLTDTSVQVRINRHVAEADVAIVIGPVFPHEVVGFSGGDKYYFLGQWEKFKQQPWGDLAHSTHLRGQGTWDAQHGERNRVTVTLATGIPEEVVRAVNRNYLDTASVDIAAYEADPETSVVPHAGEVLYRLRPGQHAGSPGEPDGRAPSTAEWEG
jgi:hypothetical protein